MLLKITNKHLLNFLSNADEHIKQEKGKIKRREVFIINHALYTALPN